MNVRMALALALVFVTVPALSGRAESFPTAPMDLSVSNVIVSDSDWMEVAFQGTAATYSNDLYLMLDSAGKIGDDGDLANDLFLFNNHASQIGSTIEIGEISPGSELLFRLYVHETGYNYYSGDRLRNPDWKVHAMFQPDWKPGVSLVSFEDLYGTPQYRLGYNDMSFSFGDTRDDARRARKIGGEIPEPGTASLLLVGVVGMIVFGRRKIR